MEASNWLVALATAALAGCAVLGMMYRRARRDGSIDTRLDGIDRQLASRRSEVKALRKDVVVLGRSLAALDAYLRGKGHINGGPAE